MSKPPEPTLKRGRMLAAVTGALIGSIACVTWMIASKTAQREQQAHAVPASAAPAPRASSCPSLNELYAQAHNACISSGGDEAWIYPERRYVLDVASGWKMTCKTTTRIDVPLKELDP